MAVQRCECPPEEITRRKQATHRSSMTLLSCTRRSWALDKLGLPCKNSGVRKAGGPPGFNLSREYSQQLGDAAAYATIPDAQTRNKGS